MKKIFPLLTLIMFTQQSVLAQCNSGSYIVTGNTVITGSCIITGNLTIQNGAVLNVDLTNATPDTFVVRGNILLQGNAELWIHSTPGSMNDQFIVSNNFNGHRTITTRGTGKIQLDNIEFRTQEGNLAGTSSISMNYNAYDSSSFLVNKSRLNNQTAWLLFNMKDKATYTGFDSDRVPTEMYLEDSARVTLHGQGTKTGIWLSCENITDTLNLPPDQTAPFSWKIGRGYNGFSAPWYLEMDTVLSGFGVQVFPTTRLTVNGAGFPNTGELKVAMMFANNTETISGLKAGLQNTTIRNGVNGIIKLNNVQLGPIAWQLYALMNENLTIKNSVVNEIGIGGPSTITVDSSILQLAVLAAVGIGGSTLTINNSEVWNQEITASNNSRIVFNNCKVTGSAFSTTDGLSRITINGGCFYKNPSGCTAATMVNIATGQPNCNPFIPPGFPQNLSPATVTFNGVNYDCPAGGNGSGNNMTISIYPNPLTESATLKTDKGLVNANLFVINCLGQIVKQIKDISGQTYTIQRGNLSSGLYFIKLVQDNKRIAVGKLVITN
jgi:hypothetical protein